MHMEPGTRKFLEALAALGGPPLQERTVADARQFLVDAQSQPIERAPADVVERTLSAGPTGEIRLRLVRPPNRQDKLPIVMYCHGGGWILGDWTTHARLVQAIAASIPALVVFVDYARSPEARFPVAIEQIYAASCWAVEHAEELNADASRLAIAGDSVGGDLATVVTMLAKERGGPAFTRQLLFYPVTDANFETPSYREFAEGTNLTRAAMRWFWDAYQPNVEQRKNPLAAPLQASLEQLKGLPPALVIVGENDVLRDEGEAYAHKLAEAGVEVRAVRYLGTVHDFVMLDGLASTPAARGAVEQGCDWLRSSLSPRRAKPGAVTFTPGEGEQVRRTLPS